ncbi:MAG TPA: DNA polymerase I [Saprospiraceae bacterium]|jgi:DNA polymerase-1|nr:DNA polymerase I [Saprospiraceae bacterium]HRP41134.1 DNA polymerase I [Saprospiraceae bacterium]
MEDKRLFLLDGHALVYRAHFAFIARPLINSKGVNTSAITGFVRTLWDLMKHQKPTHIAVAFDPKGGTFRHEIYPEYKANRDAQPEDITIAMQYIPDIIKAFNIPVVMVPNYEADDVIGTLAKKAEKKGFSVYMVTPDKDYAQLVSENIYMYKPGKQGNEAEILGEKEILKNWDIQSVEQVIDVLGLQGDSVDNIPGIPGIGPKTAVTLLKQFGSVENIIANAEQLKGKQKENVITFANQALLSKKLATIDTNSPVEFDEFSFTLDAMDRTKLKEIFLELEFRSLAEQILGSNHPIVQNQGIQQSLFDTETTSSVPETPSDNKINDYQIGNKSIENTPHTYHTIHTDTEILALVDKLSGSTRISFDTETTGINAHEAELVGASLAVTPHEGYYIPFSEDFASAKAKLSLLKPLLENEQIEKIGQNIKYDMTILKWYGIELKGRLFDTMIAHYLCEPDLRHKLDFLTESYLDYKMVPIEDLIGRSGKNQLSMRDIDVEKVSQYAAEDADLTMQLVPVLEKMMAENQLTEIYNTIESPLIRVLCDIEYEGVNINVQFLNEYSKELEKLIVEKEREIYKSAGTHFNIASPKQVGEILFDRLKIPYRWKKTSSGQYSTDVDKMTELYHEHDIIKAILDYRKYAKLKSTYVDALPLQVNPKTGRIHSNFNQARVATGRLSSENPNMQNIPIKNEAGREIRKAFIPRNNDYVILAADYSQIELRIIADMSKDASMLESFAAGNDFHRATASKVYGVPYDEVTADQRRNAKTVNFSITYGAGATNLSRQLGISRNDATELIQNYFKEFSGMKQYIDSTVQFARDNGYVKTLLGRRRYLRDINSRNSLTASNAERVAINAPIQGTAAEMIKIAMIDIFNCFEQQNLKSKMIIQVHDELVFDVYKPELEQVKSIIRDKMENAIPQLSVPILVQMDIGDNWLEAH